MQSVSDILRNNIKLIINNTLPYKNLFDDLFKNAVERINVSLQNNILQRCLLVAMLKFRWFDPYDENITLLVVPIN